MTQSGRGLAAALAVLLLAGCARTIAPVAPALLPLVIPPRIVDGADFHLSGRIEQGGLAIGTTLPGTVALRFDGQPISFAADGRFLVAFDRDHVTTATIDARLTDGSIHRATIAIAPRSWKIESLPTLARGTTPSPEYLARRKIETDQINAARAAETGAAGWRQRFIWPVTGRISGLFGSQRIYAGEPGAYHSGVDVARPTGTTIVAPADGVVILAAASPFSLEGNLLMIDHGMGMNSAFLHLSRIDVKVGQAVKQGQPLGAIGMTGRATGPHLHWSIKWRDARIDPQPLAGPMPQ